jgi:hypothetical protein
VPILPPPVDFGAILDFRDFQKGTLWTTFFAERAPKSQSPELGVTSLSVFEPTLAPPAPQHGPKTLQDQIFIEFGPIHIFQNRSQRPFLGGPCADLASTGRFWCHFRFFQKLAKARLEPTASHFQWF